MTNSRSRRTAQVGRRMVLESLEDRAAPTGLTPFGSDALGLDGLFSAGFGSVSSNLRTSPASPDDSTGIFAPRRSDFATGYRPAVEAATLLDLPMMLLGGGQQILLYDLAEAGANFNESDDDGGPQVQSPESPTISNFRYSVLPGTNTHIFKGDVSGTDMVGQTVTFGGLPGLAGPPPLTATVVIGNLGQLEFTLEVTLPAGTQGLATAITQDSQGQQSNEATTYVGG